MLRFKDFLIERFDIIGALKDIPPLEQHVISPLETHYTAPLTNTHSIAVMFNPSKRMPDNTVEVNWKFHGPDRFPEKSYTKHVHTRVMRLVAKAIQQHLAAKPHINSITGFAMTPGLDRSYARTLSTIAKQLPGARYHKSKTPFSSVFGTHQHSLVLPNSTV